ncbi:MAG TPA: NADH-quinone oxidoreductase subunit I [Terriglobia bacterium]|nr:NADH-quinone oxidoreductase subunit I [Terriglobia bacterium]
MTPVKGGYAVDVPTINVSARARKENATVWSTFNAFGVTLRRLFTSLVKRDIPTISYPEQQRNYSERFRGTHILTVRDDGSLKCVACYMCATICPAECIYIEAGEHPNPEIEKFPERFDIDMMRCIYCGFCVDACPEEAIVLSREHHQAVYNRKDALYSIEKLMARPGIDQKGPGYRPNRPFAEAKLFDKATQQSCAYPSVTDERHPAVLYESMIRKRQ